LLLLHCKNGARHSSEKSKQRLSYRSGHDVPAAEIDAGGCEGAVRLFGRGAGHDGGTGFKLAHVDDLQTLNPTERLRVEEMRNGVAMDHAHVMRDRDRCPRVA
jgi:hypothetical protein